jgi:hypothetical protein
MKTRLQPPVPSHLKIQFEFDARWDHERNGLFMDGSGRLFLADVCYGGESISVHGMKVPVEQADPSCFEPVTLKEVMEWYLRCSPWSTSSTGDLAFLLCRLAVNKLKN